MAEVVIFGTGDAAELAHYYFTRDSEHRVVAFTVDGAYRKADRFLDLPVVDFEEVANAFPPSQYAMFVAMGYVKMNHIRAEKYAGAKALGYTLVSYVSSKCTWLTDHAPGDNCFILEDNTVQPFVRIGSNVTLWSGNHIGHHGVIGDHCFISSHVVVSGRVQVGEYCFLGVNATIRDGVTIGSETLVGAGAVIMDDTEPRSVYVPERTALFPRKSDRIKI